MSVYEKDKLVINKQDDTGNREASDISNEGVCLQRLINSVGLPTAGNCF